MARAIIGPNSPVDVTYQNGEIKKKLKEVENQWALEAMDNGVEVFMTKKGKAIRCQCHKCHLLVATTFDGQLWDTSGARHKCHDCMYKIEFFDDVNDDVKPEDKKDKIDIICHPEEVGKVDEYMNRLVPDSKELGPFDVFSSTRIPEKVILFKNKDGIIIGTLSCVAPQENDRLPPPRTLQEWFEVDFPVTIYRIDEDDGIGFYYFAFHPGFGHSACSAVGDTREEAIAALDLVRQDVIKHYYDAGKTIPEPSPTPFLNSDE